MSSTNKPTLTATTEIYAPIAKVWELWNNPDDIRQWNNLSDDWHTTKAENDLRVGGKFFYAMGLKDGSFSFDFTGVYNEILPYQFISYTLNDGRRSTITFKDGSPVKLTENFEPENTQPFDMQRDFCQSVLNTFKAYVEGK